MRSAIFLSALLLSEPLAKMADYSYSKLESNTAMVFFFLFLLWDVLEFGKTFTVKMIKK